MKRSPGFTCRFTAWTTLALLLTPGIGITIAKAQVAEPVFPLPNSTNEISDRPIELKLTEQPEIKTDSIQVQLNGTLLDGNLSIDTSDLSLGFQATPTSYNLGNNTLTVQFETQAGVQSEFTWPFIVSTVTADAEPEAEAVPETDAEPVALAPEFTTQAVEEDALVLAGKTRPGAEVTLNVMATRPVASLFDLGPFSVSTGEAEQREMSASAVADSDGSFQVEFDVTGDPVQTEYQVDAIATQGDTQETTTVTLQR